MKKNVLLILLFITYTAMSQSLSVFDVDASNFPTIKAKFFAFDKDGKQLTILNPSDFEVKENGVIRNVISVSCPAPKPPRALSSVLVFDVSGSMLDGPPRIQSAKDAANAWIDGLPLGKSECALTSFNENSFVIQDLTTFRDKLKVAINKLTPNGGTDYNQALIDLPAGGLQIAKMGKYKKVIVFLTDGLPNTEPNTSEIIKFANDNQITIYAVTLDMPAPQSIKDMTTQTGGQYFENITTRKEAEDTYSKLLQSAQGGTPCEIEWIGKINCKPDYLDVQFNLNTNNSMARASYLPTSISNTRLEFQPSTLNFKNMPPGVIKDTVITLTAKYADLSVLDIKTSNPNFSIKPTNFNLKSNESINLTVSYNPKDSGYAFSTFEFIADGCNYTFSVVGGFSKVKPKVKTLRLTYPNGGEELEIGSEAVITWAGIPESDTCSLEYSIDKGVTWNLITKEAIGLQYLWKDIPKPASNSCLVRIKQLAYIDPEGAPGSVQFVLRHGNKINKILWSEDGSKVITVSDDTTAIAWNTNFGNKFMTFNHPAAVSDFVWNYKTDKIVTVCSNGRVYSWSIKFLTFEFTFEPYYSKYTLAKLSDDGSKLAIMNSRNTVFIWDPLTGKNISDLKGYIINTDVGIEWHPQFNHLLTDGSSSCIWNGVTEEKILDFYKDRKVSLENPTWSPDGERIASTTGYKIKIWNSISGENILTNDSHWFYVNHIAWSQNGRYIASSSDDTDLQIMDSYTGEVVHKFEGHKGKVTGISWHYDSELVATIDDDNTCVIWDINEGKRKFTLRGHSDTINNVSWSIDPSRIATSSDDNTAILWYLDYSMDVLQSDTSDAVFSIVAPQPIVNDIDMKQELVGGVKDSLIHDFVFNNGNHAFKVDSISITGADADVFSLVSGFPPFSLNGKESKTVEMRFVPNRVGLHQAQINVYMRDEIITRNIIGEGVAPRLELVTDFIDFGAVEIQNFKDTIQVATIKNIGNAPITISKTVHGFPNDVDFTTLSDGGSFTLQQNEIHKMDLRFTASSIGRTSGTLEFHYDGVGSPAVVQLYGQGLGGNVIIPDDSAFAGDRIKVKLVLGNEIKPKSNDLITNFKVILSYNPTLLYCDEPSAKRKYNKNIETIELNGKWDGTSSSLGTFDFIVGLGNANTTEITLEEFYWFDKDNNVIDFEVEKQSGTFTLLGICEEGGTRLLNPYSKAGITSISPNPAENFISIELSLSEFGATELSLYNLLGEKVSTIFLENVSQKSIIELNSDISKIGSGQYLLIFRTPTYTETRQLLILR